ncbi:hypothetical protein [Celeribacter sp.]|uniref:hypothetical protein n=1 Tax=Celeribacter sp. TaxID=1890673 RepID=UPI003A8DEF68
MKFSLAALAFCIATPVLAAETDVQIASGSNTLAATLNLPEDSVLPPVVLMLHGFTGVRRHIKWDIRAV